MASYPVIFRRDEDGWWIAELQGVQGCHTQGRTVAEARERIREALAVCTDDEHAGRAELIDDIRPDEPAP